MSKTTTLASIGLFALCGHIGCVDGSVEDTTSGAGGNTSSTGQGTADTTTSSTGSSVGGQGGTSSSSASNGGGGSGECVPSCDGKQCGDDGCGNSCGSCPAGQQCEATGQCLAACDPKGSDDKNMTAQMPALAQPAAAASYIDPVFGSSIRRVSAASDSDSFEVGVYSQLQAFSANNTYLLTTSPQGYRIRQRDNLKVIRTLSDINAPRWDPSDDAHVIHYDTNGDAIMRIQRTNVVSGATTTIETSNTYRNIYASRSFDEISRDGRWLAGIAAKSDNSGDVIFAYDIKSQSYGAEIAINDLFSGPCTPDPQWGILTPDWVAPSPLGNYLMVQWVRDGSTRCSGLETFDIKTGKFLGRVYTTHAHGDLGLVKDWQNAPANAREFFMTFELGQNGVLVTYRFLPGTPDGTSGSKQLLELAWGNSDHISCQGPAGSCLVTAGPGNLQSGTTPGIQPFENEIFTIDLNGGVKRIAHHRSSECGYWAQPRASWSRDGRYAIFASDWGQSPCSNDSMGEADAYIVNMQCTP